MCYHSSCFKGMQYIRTHFPKVKKIVEFLMRLSHNTVKWLWMVGFASYTIMHYEHCHGMTARLTDMAMVRREKVVEGKQKRCQQDGIQEGRRMLMLKESYM